MDDGLIHAAEVGAETTLCGQPIGKEEAAEEEVWHTDFESQSCTVCVDLARSVHGKVWGQP